MTQELTLLSYEELLDIDGGLDWEAAANAAWIATIACSAVPTPATAAASIICGCFAGGYYIGKFIAG